MHRAGSAREEFFQEFPLELELSGTIDNMYELLSVISESGHVFALKGLRIEPAGGKRANLLDIRAIMSALVFVKNPGELKTATTPIGPVRTGVPLGH
jgi:hypothetical protein